MRKIYSLFFMLLIGAVSLSFGQSNQISTLSSKKSAKVNIQNVNQISKLKSNNKDTISFRDFINAGSPQALLNSGGGWVFGVNKLSSPAVAQGFKLSLSGFSSAEITDVLFWVAGVTKVSAHGSSLTISVRNIDDSSHYTIGLAAHNISCPDTLSALGTVNFPWNGYLDTLTSASTYLAKATFASPVRVSGDFAVVIDYSSYYTNHDTIGLLCSANGGASAGNGLNYTWWKYHNPNIWTLYTDIYNNNPDNSIATWPIVGNTTGIQENEYINGLNLSQNFPNPADNNCTISYGLQNEGNVNLIVLDNNGKVVYNINEGNKPAGHYNVNLDISNLASGTYYYSLSTGDSRITRKMLITK